MSNNKKSPIEKVKVNKIIYPILIGLGVVIFMLYQELNVDKLKIRSLNINPEKEDWIESTINETKDTVFVEITDSLVAQKDSLELELKYFIEHNPGKTISFSDTIWLTCEKEVISNKAHFLVEAKRTGRTSLQFVFSEPLKHAFKAIDFTWNTFFWLIVGLLLMFTRDFGYMVRLRILADKKINWLQSFKVIMLWEFTSAITPSAIGGTSVAILYVNKEGLNVGRSTAVVMATSFLDELFFIIMFPLLFFIISGSDLFGIGATSPSETFSFTNEFFYFAVVGYLLKFFYTLLIVYGLFINPRGLKWLMLMVFKIPFLRRWREGANKAGTDLIVSSNELRKKSFKFWFNAFIATIFSWTARYWVVNAILLAFFGGTVFGFNEHFLIYARQLVMWIMMLVSPTPGGSGFAEFVFTEYLGEFIPVAGLAVAMALLWRIITYYPYLFIGVLLFPRWIKRKFGKRKHAVEATKE